MGAVTKVEGKSKKVERMHTENDIKPKDKDRQPCADRKWKKWTKLVCGGGFYNG